MTNFWKIECPHCGINSDLLRDKYFRLICRECLHKNEFKEVENEICSDSDEENKNIGNRDDIHGTDFSNSDSGHNRKEISNGVLGEE